LPVILPPVFTNTPAERAISEMVTRPVANVVEKTPPVYFHYDPQDSGASPAPAMNPPTP